jgi:hypothetical protein
VDPADAIICKERDEGEGIGDKEEDKDEGSGEGAGDDVDSCTRVKLFLNCPIENMITDTMSSALPLSSSSPYIYHLALQTCICACLT